MILVEVVPHKILLIRGQKIMSDFDSAMLYGVETRVLLQAVKRNLSRFPPDFAFQCTENEYASLRSQFVISKKGRGGGGIYLCIY